MQKSIKKVIAGAVAALMITSSMPFVALAAPGDYAPDVQLQFSTFCDDPSDPTNTTAANATAYKASGLAGFPIQWDQKNGTLIASKEDINVYNEYWETDAVAEDWVLGEDDIFAVTVRMDNITEAWGANVDIKFSDNLTPAGVWQSGTGKKAKFSYGNEDNAPTQPEALSGFRAPIKDWSASGLYDGMNDTALGDPCKIQEDPNAVEGDGWSDLIISATYLSGGESTDVSSVDSELGFFDITNGTYDSDNGYTYEGKAIMATFVFQITGEGPIQFDINDPTSEYSDTLDGAYLIAKKSDGTTAADKTTYAINKYNLATMKNDGDVEHPGSAKMTFMGKNSNKGEEPQTETYTIVFKDKNGEVISSTDYEADAEVTIPALPANTYDDTKHYSYAWDTTPSATATADATYQVVETAAAHVYGEGVVNPTSTCTTAGKVTYTCECGKSYTEDAPLADHTPGTAVKENDVPSTCNTLGGYDSVVYCTECNAEISRTHVDYTEYAAHTPGTAVKENDVPSTCTVPGGYDMVTRCTVCGTQIGQPEHHDYELAAHTAADAVKENEVAATKKDKGSYDMVVYCTECGVELSRETFYTDALGVTVTITKSDIGSVEGLEVGANKLAYGANINLTATPVEGAHFVGWEINGNIVSKDATYSTKAVADVTITPVFVDATGEEITVTFYDKYGNTVKQYKDVTVEAYQAAIAAEYDSIVAPTYPSYTFESWDKSKDEILAIDSSTTIWANYVKVDEASIAKYTVTTSAQVITPNGIKNGEIPYDTMVTVRDTAAKAWKIGDAIVAYGTEYSFYVGSDVAVDPVYTLDEDIKANVTVIGANLVAGSDYKYNIVATRNVPDGYNLVDYGFVYGKALTDEELNLDMVGQVALSGATIKAAHGGTRNTDSNEFAINYGIKAKNAPIKAKAFVVVEKAGETEIIYSETFIQNYE
jgi:hypothetical protein